MSKAPFKVLIPRISPNDDFATISEWMVKTGENVEEGDLIGALETSKSIFEIRAEQSGFLHILKVEGEYEPVLSVIALISDSAEVPEFEVQAEEIPSGAASVSDVSATDKARALAEKLGIDINKVTAEGIIREKDVTRYLKENPPENRGIDGKGADDKSGTVDSELLEEIRKDTQKFGSLSSDEKIERYRAAGAKIGKNVTFGSGTILECLRIVIGDDTVIDKDVLVQCQEFILGELVVIGHSTKIFCKSFKTGNTVTIRFRVAIVDGEGGINSCTIGDNCFIAYDTYINTDADVTMGNYVCMSPGSRIYTHRKWQSPLEGYSISYAPVSLGEYCWLGPNAIVLPGVSLQDRVTVMANSLVTHSLEGDSLLGGVPAKEVVKSSEYRRDLTLKQRHEIALKIIMEAEEKITNKGFEIAGWEADAGSIRFIMKNSEGEALVAYPAEKNSNAGTARKILLTLKNTGEVKADSETTVIYLLDKRIKGKRDEFSDVIREYLSKNAINLEPRIWRPGKRLEETSY